MLTTCDDQRKGESKTGSNVRHSRHAGDRDKDERKAQEIESTRPIGDDLVGSPRGGGTLPSPDPHTWDAHKWV